MSNKRSFHECKLLDELIMQYNLHNDAGVARFLRVEAPVISRVRTGHGVSDPLRLRILRETNWPISRLDQLAPPQK